MRGKSMKKKQEIPKFEKVEFRLTKSQKSLLAKFASEIDKGYLASNGEDLRLATLANIYLARGGDKVEVFLIRPPQTGMINRAIVRVRKTIANEK